ncbi:MAG: serine/threonine-protein kinase, partial [Acidobacteriota bacterium]
AEREDEHFERRVAVKVLRAGFESPELIRRFVAERQILARLEHPNIARLYEGGATADGRPFLVMEYVDGRPIDRYCDEEKLGVAERIEVIRKVCGAVQYAHRHLVVHRDLKPSNILVDNEGEPKLLDFGIAKLLDPGSFPMTVEATRTGLSPMTPHYASPEQVRGEAITTSTDVYALGVLLYRLLAGRLPYHFDSGVRNHILQVLEKSGPTRPSLVILESTADDLEPKPLPHLLGIPPAELQRTLAGDLDSIAMKALRPEPEHRYASPEHLAADLRRHRAGLPVHARQGNWRYRVHKFVRRHRVAVGLAATATLLLATLSIFMTWQAAQIAKERNAALAARDEAQTAQQAERQVVQFLTGLFEKADPRQAKGEDLTARQLLEQGAERVRADLTDRPEVQARLLLTMADVYHQLSLYQDSVDLAAESVALREAAGASPRDIAVARLTEASGLTMLGQLDEAAARLDLIEAGLGPGTSEQPRISSTRGLVAFSRGDFEEAIGHFEAAIDTGRSQPTPDHGLITRSFSNLGFALEQLGRPAEAETAYLESLELAELHLGSDHPAVATALNNLGACLKDQGKVEAARDYYRRALELRELLFGGDHLQTAQTRANLAVLDAEAGRWREAVPAFQQTIEAFEKHLGPKHPHVGMAWNNLGQCFRQLGDYPLASTALDRGLEAVVASVGDDHPIAAQNLLQRAALELDRDRIAPANSYFARIQTILEGSVGPEHTLFTSLAKGRCRAQMLAGAEDAVATCERALETNRRQYGDIHRSSLGTSAALVKTLLDVGRVDDAAAALDAADDVAEATTGPEHPDRLPLHLVRGELLLRRGQKREALFAFQSALGVADRAVLDASHPLKQQALEGIRVAR